MGSPHVPSRAVDAFLERLVGAAGRLVALTATRDDGRRPVGWVQDVFLVALVDGLEARGVSRRVAADMLGTSRRTLQRQVQGARERSQQRRRTVWLRVVEAIEQQAPRPADLGDHVRGVPHAVLVSVLADLQAAGWVREERGRLRAVRRRDLPPEALLAYLQAHRHLHGTTTFEALAADLGVEVSALVQAWSSVEEPFHWHAEGSSRWVALELLVDRLEAFLAAELVGGRVRTAGGTWTVRIDNRADEVLETLQGARRQAQEVLSRTAASLAARGVYEPGTARRWVTVLLEIVEQEEDEGVRSDAPGGAAGG